MQLTGRKFACERAACGCELPAAALAAILYREPEAAAFAQLIHDADVCRMSVANYVELAMVVESQLGPEGMQQAQTFFFGGRPLLLSL